MALPLYEGRMIGQFDFSEKGWVSGKGRGAVWREIPWGEKQIEPQYLMGVEDYYERIDFPWEPKLVHMNIGSATNARTAIGSFVAGMPCGHSAPILALGSIRRALDVTAVFGSLVSDFVTRSRVTGLHLDYHVLEQNPLVLLEAAVVRSGVISEVARALCLTARGFAPATIELVETDSDMAGTAMAVTLSERLRMRAILDATIAAAFGLTYFDLRRILAYCDLPSIEIAGGQLNPKGFWRLDRKLDPELRHTVLTLVAFRNLESKIHEASGDRDDGIREFFAQNEGEGWLLPETLRLADYGLGHDDRAQHHQPVASRLAPRFFDWQLARSSDESSRECHVHARNLLGRVEYAHVIDRLIGHRGLSEGDYHDVLSGQFARELVPAGDGDVRYVKAPGAGALRAAERHPGSSATPSAERPQTEIFSGPQTDMFE